MPHLFCVKMTPPSAITLLGDSPGGHLLLALMLHLTSPTPLVPSLLVCGVFSEVDLISSWVCLDMVTDPMHAEEFTDLLTVSALSYWARKFLHISTTNQWNAPLSASPECWASFSVGKFLIIFGTDELLQRDITRLCTKLHVVSTHNIRHYAAHILSWQLSRHSKRQWSCRALPRKSMFICLSTI